MAEVVGGSIIFDEDISQNHEGVVRHVKCLMIVQEPPIVERMSLMALPNFIIWFSWIILVGHYLCNSIYLKVFILYLCELIINILLLNKIMLEEELQEIGVSDKIRPVSLLILDEGVVESLIKEA